MKRTLTLLFSLLATGGVLAYEPPVTYPESYTIDDLIYAGPSGSIAQRTLWIDGIEQSEKFTFHFPNGQEVYVEHIHSSKSTFIKTPSYYFRIKYISGRKYQVRDMYAGVNRTLWAPQGGVPTPSNLSMGQFPNESGWLGRYQDLLLEWEAHRDQASFIHSVSHPLGKYQVSSYVQNAGSECNQTVCNREFEDFLWYSTYAIVQCIGGSAVSGLVGTIVACGGSVIIVREARQSYDDACGPCNTMMDPSDDEPDELPQPGIGGSSYSCDGFGCGNYDGNFYSPRIPRCLIYDTSGSSGDGGTHQWSPRCIVYAP